MKVFFHKLKIAHLIVFVAVLLLCDVFFFVRMLPSLFVRDIANFLSVFISLPNTKPSCRDCNIILISVDTLGANHLPCYGYVRNTSPNLCAFGKENIIAQNMFANSSFTLPSHVSLFTGLYPMTHNVNVPHMDSLNKNIPLLPEVLKKNGYETYFCMTKTDPHLPIQAVYNRGIDGIYQTSELINWNTCLKKLIANNKIGKKTFIFLHTYHVHAPYIPKMQIKQLQFLTHEKIPSIPETMDQYFAMKYNDDFFPFFIDRLQKDIEGGHWGNKTKTYERVLRSLNTIHSENERLRFLNNTKNSDVINEYLGTYYTQKTSTLKKQQVGRLADLYDTTILELDTYLGSVLNRIKENNLWNNTIITITSDHGEEFMEHERVVGHGANLYDTTTKVPLIMRIPGIRSKTIDRITESTDIFPTLLSVAGIKNTVRTQGLDIFNSSQKKYAMSDLIYPDWVIRSNRDSQWKLYIKQEKKEIVPYALYNTSKDKDEYKNLIYQPVPAATELLIPFIE